MKFTLIFLTTAIAGVIAAPPQESRDGLGEADLEARASCWNRSGCGRAWSGKCEDYCKPYKFSHMAKTDCGCKADIKVTMRSLGAFWAWGGGSMAFSTGSGWRNTSWQDCRRGLVGVPVLGTVNISEL
ncbi:hypothetical protein VFPPC_16200 [Pochonia chlamydosporia 170]|uniref:Uncharacterized protein n=1 Tax=Pochonia chlamydosporia 170 TaxID=1380566 RepID=A0A179FG34_METCM|nr:hypothetical protein VFPPC_16200 [Pochonia chlamydosporia 170]OAQ64308.1 hypothetical protein VFPPC_16200 [Pochonia chlamydosporia 170]